MQPLGAPPPPLQCRGSLPPPPSPPQNYYDNRYYTMWKLPMFGCTDASQVLKEVAACTAAFPTSYVRLVAFDNQKQVQCMGFLVQRPASATDYCPVERRSV
jgi:ribulose-bisphosphate carboxylase small chain